MLVISLISLCVVLLSLFIGLIIEVNLLNELIAKLDEKNFLTYTSKLKNPLLKKVYSSIIILLIKFKKDSTLIDSEVLSMGVRIANKVAQPNAVAEELTNLVSEKIGRELVGVAVLLIDSGKLNITQSVGLPIKRIANAVELTCEEVFTNNSWGYQSQAGISDFSIFGIKRSLIVPMRYENKIEGIIWLGLSSALLTADKAESLKQLAEYAAASFQVAKNVVQEKEYQQKEKDFLLGLSHDLRSPGNRALFCVRDLLYDRSLNLNPENKQQLEIIELSIAEQMTMINDVLDIAKHQGGLLVSKPIRVNLLEELRELKNRYQPDLERKNLLLEFNCSESIDLYVDLAHLRRILNNLASNAIKYTNFGGVFVEVADLDSHIEILFKDTGSGISEHMQPRIFEKFSPSSNGHGLGLYLVKALAEINNGNVVSYPTSFSGANLGVRIPTRAVND